MRPRSADRGARDPFPPPCRAGTPTQAGPGRRLRGHRDLHPPRRPIRQRHRRDRQRAFHYLWGGGYVMDAAKRGYIAYTNCTSTLAEVVPFGGKFPTLGTNPHSWGFPTMDALGYPVVIDWATSEIAMGQGRTVQAREQKARVPLRRRQGRKSHRRPLRRGRPPSLRPPQGLRTRAPQRALRCGHRGIAADPARPGRQGRGDREKTTCAFYFQVVILTPFPEGTSRTGAPRPRTSPRC